MSPSWPAMTRWRASVLDARALRALAEIRILASELAPYPGPEGIRARQALASAERELGVARRRIAALEREEAELRLAELSDEARSER